MFTIATWNPNKGLGILEKRNPSHVAKESFINDTLNLKHKVDVAVLSDFSDGFKQPIDLKYKDFKYSGRTYCGIQKGNITKLQDERLGDSNYMRLEYESLSDGIITILAIYAAGSLVEAHRNLENVLDRCRSWLSQPKTLIVGDLNIWENLAGGNGKRSLSLLEKISKLGLRSAFHNDAGRPGHKQTVQRGRFDNIDLTTYEDRHGQTYVDYIFHSKDLKVVPGSSSIIHFKTKEEMELTKREKMTKSGRQDHSAVVATLTSECG